MLMEASTRVYSHGWTCHAGNRQVVAGGCSSVNAVNATLASSPL